MHLGPTPQRVDEAILILTPPSLSQVGREVEAWLESRVTPVKLVSVSEGLKLIPTRAAPALALYHESARSDSEIALLSARVALMSSEVRARLRLWCLDGSAPPSQLASLHHPKRLRALALLLGDLTLPRALAQAQQAPPRDDEAMFQAPPLAQLESALSEASRYAQHFTWPELQERVSRIKRVAQWSRLPISVGLLGLIGSLLMVGSEYPRVIATWFVCASLTLGIGVIGMAWAYLEHSGLRQRVYLFWRDPILSGDDHSEDHAT